MILQSQKPDIKELNRDALVDFFERHGMRKFRADQVLRWVYSRRAASFEQMTDLAKDARRLLQNSFSLDRLHVEKIETSADGTRKFLYTLKDQNQIESVLIPEKDHYTLCISTQVGCAMGCAFCMTAKGGLARNLNRGEIIGQVISAQDAVEDDMRLSNIVLMGMGEPLANYENVASALEAITDSDWGLKFSTRRVTLSTAGLINRFDELGRDTSIRLAISLNATENRTRDRLMPINKTIPIEKLLDACARYPLPPRDKITFEYILLKGVNDSPEDARRLARLLRPIRAKINLIPYNPHPGSEFDRPATADIEAFQSILHQKHYTAIIRWSKGTDISAACGQLRAGN